MVSSAVVGQASGGLPAPVMKAAFMAWFTKSIMPFLTAKDYTGPAAAEGPLTTVFEAQ